VRGPEEAAVLEALEETGLGVRIGRLTWVLEDILRGDEASGSTTFSPHAKPPFWAASSRLRANPLTRAAWA